MNAINPDEKTILTLPRLAGQPSFEVLQAADGWWVVAVVIDGGFASPEEANARGAWWVRRAHVEHTGLDTDREG